jgi:hypothetical protein
MSKFFYIGPPNYKLELELKQCMVGPYVANPYKFEFVLELENQPEKWGPTLRQSSIILGTSTGFIFF